MGSHWIAKLAGIENVITIDMGGTSADICLITEGRYLTTNQSEIGGHAIKVPMIDINTIGAGGGSIAWIDLGGALRVGPRSAGADPGPACYGKGGTEPTVTDANLVLGRLNPNYYVGGEMPLDVERARAVVRERVAEPLNLSLEAAAEGILKVVNANMTRGIRLVSIERGHDPRHFSLFAFGGGGALHAVDLAEELNIPQVIIPIHPGVNSAVGLLIADFRYDYSKTYLSKFEAIHLSELNELYQEMEGLARQQLVDASISEKDIVLSRSADIRYYGQGYEIEIPVPGGRLISEKIGIVKQAFDDLHNRLYGYCQPKEEKEIVYLRLAAVGRVKKPELYREPRVEADASHAIRERRHVFIDGRFVETSIYDRSRLKPGNQISGPAIIEQMDSTSLMKKGQTSLVDEHFNLVVRV